MWPYRIIRSVNTNLRKLRTLNESDGNSENELLEIETDEYEGQGSSENRVGTPDGLYVFHSCISLIENTMISRMSYIHFELRILYC